jgi:hypothetical protein
MKPIRVLLIFTAALATSACDRLASADMIKMKGGWAPPGQACDSPSGVYYDKAGRWAGYNVAGQWKLRGVRLTTWVTERGGYDQPGRKVRGEKATVFTVLSLSQTDLTLKQDDGSTLTLKRCRS